jgi:Putative adhesin
MNVKKMSIAFVTLLLAVSHAYAEAIDRRIDADARGEVEIVNVAGSVRVTGWDKNEVQVRGELGRNVVRLDVERDGNHVLVKVALPKIGSSGGSDLEINVPRNSSVTTNTVSASQVITNVTGAQRLQSVSGKLESQLGDSEFNAKSVSGSITLKGSQSAGKPASTNQTRATTVSGDILIENAQGSFELRSVSGTIHVSARPLSRTFVKTTSGDLQLAGTLATDAAIEAETISGQLNVNLEGALDATFDIESHSGRIDNCFGPKPKRRSEHGPGTELRFQEGEGHSQVRLKTLSGSVRLCRKT